VDRIATKNTRLIPLPLVALFLSVAVGTIFTLLPVAYLAAAVSTAAALVLIVLNLIEHMLGKVKLVAALGVLLLSGFLGTYTEIYGITALNDWIRWIPPLTLLCVAVYNLARTPGLVSNSEKNLRDFMLPLTIFLAYAVLSVSYSVLPEITFGRSITFLAITAGAFVALLPQLRTERDIELLLWAIAILMGIAILSGEILLVPPGGIGWLNGRFRSSFWNPVTLGHMAAVFCPLFVWIASDARLQARYRLMATIISTFLLLNIFLSQSRSAALGIIAASTVYILSLPTRVKIAVILIFTVVFVVMLGLGVGPGQFIDFFTRSYDLDDPAIASGRAPAWTVAYQSWQLSPIWGYGFGTGGDPRLSLDLLGASGGVRVSNVYLETLSTGGLIGVALLAALLGTIFVKLLVAMRSSSSQVRNLGFFAMSTFVCGLVLNLFETWFSSAGSPFAFYWWLVLFLVIRRSDLIP
jgi:O-antigen ligase